MENPTVTGRKDMYRQYKTELKHKSYKYTE